MSKSRLKSVIHVVAIVLLYASASAAAQGVGDSAPNFSYTTLAGQQISMADFSGKVLFIFFFGYGCPTCLAVGNRTETEINAVYASNEDFQAIGLDLWNGASGAVSAFKAQTGVTFPLGLQASSAAGIFSTTYDRLMIVDREGIIRYKGASNVSNTLTAAKAVLVDQLATATAAESEIPSRFALESNFPNPFNPTTTISFLLTRSTDISLTIYDQLGNEVRTLAQGVVSAGRHTVQWDATDNTGSPVASGVYLYSLRTEKGVLSKVMTMLK